jgi:hypothetical protein
VPNKRCALLAAKAAENMAEANHNFVETAKQVVAAHHGLIRQTRYLVFSTWGIVALTLISQAALILAEFIKNRMAIAARGRTLAGWQKW